MSETSPAPNRFWNVPFKRNPLFTGREDVLRDLESGLQGGPVALGQAIAGLGGIGKTQTAVEFAYRHRDKYEAVLWVPAETESQLVAGFAALATLLDLPEKDEAQQQLAVDAVQRWLQTHQNWLLILDNADDLKLASRFVPDGARGHVIYTTRSSVTGRLARRLPLEKLSAELGAEFLLKRAGKPSAHAAPEWDDAKALSDSLGGLPLALEQAGAFIEENHLTIREYQRLYESEGVKLMARHGDLGDDSHLPVTITFSVAFEQLETQNPMAARLLRLCAFFAPDNIPEEILESEYRDIDEALGGTLATELERTELIHDVCSRSLMTRDAADRSLSMHRLVQLVLRESLEAEEKQAWAAHAVNVLNAAFPSVEFENWPLCERLLSHSLLCLDHAAQQDVETQQAARLCNQVAFYLSYRAQYAAAEPLYKRALAVYEKVLGPEHPDTAAVLNNLANLYRDQGNLSEAEPMLERALAIDEKVSGPEHPDTATDLNSLAVLYYAQGKLSKAEPLYKRALAIREKVLGPEHPDTAQSLGNLASLYCDQGKLSEAEPLFERALTIREKTLGSEHPDTATSLNNLAALYYDQGNLSEAEPLFERALEIREKALGDEHPLTLQARENLAFVRREMDGEK